MKRFFFLAATTMLATITLAQSRVFKEVSDDIRSEFHPILQDQSLVGYLMSTQLEKVSEDSFNYKLTIMDENLNDIGIVNFKDESISLKSVAFENDLLSLVFIKSRLLNKGFKNNREANAARQSANPTTVVVRFMDLSGKTVKEHQYRVDPDVENIYNAKAAKSERVVVPIRFRHSPVIKNVPGKGFALFYRDKKFNNNKLTLFDNAGQELWKRDLAKEESCYLLTSPESLSLLAKKLESDKHYTMQVMGLEKNSRIQRIDLKDNKGNNLSVMDIGNDPVTHKPYVAGMILHQRNSQLLGNYNGFFKGPFVGVYSIGYNDDTTNKISKKFSYWTDSEIAGHVYSNGKLKKNRAQPLYNTSTRDDKGNYYFTGVSMVRKPKWGIIGVSAITAPLILMPPIILAIGGSRKVRTDDGVVVMQDANGKLTLHSQINVLKSSFAGARAPFGYKTNSYYSTSYGLKGNDGKTNYFILDNPKEITIYNINNKKVARTIPHKDGSITTNIGPAKEGHIMVLEYNKKEKSTRLSIEAL